MVEGILKYFAVTKEWQIEMKYDINFITKYK